MFSDFHLVDLTFHLTGQDDFATYTHGSKRIDYILCDTWVSDASLQGCYEPFQYDLKGDHHAMVVGFDTHLQLQNTGEGRNKSNDNTATETYPK